jgi:hypothetical protein
MGLKITLLQAGFNNIHEIIEQAYNGQQAIELVSEAFH